MAPRVRVQRRDELIGAARGIALVAASALPLAMALVFYRQLAEFRDPFATWMEDADILIHQTEWGRMWLWGVAGSFATPLAFALAAGDTSAGSVRTHMWEVAGALTAVFCFFPAFNGHAAGTDGLVWLSISADGLHVLAAGSWIGGLGYVLYAERRARRRGAPSVLPELVPIFSPIAMVSVAVLVVTGALGSFLHVEGFGALFGSTYGRLLVAKLLLVSVVLGLGAYNWRKLTPRLTDADGPDAIRRAAALELFVAHLVIVVTALLVRTSPMHDWSWSNIGH